MRELFALLFDIVMHIWALAQDVFADCPCSSVDRASGYGPESRGCKSCQGY